MLLAIELGSDVMQNIVCNTKSIIFVTVITIPCKTIRKKKNDNKKKVMQKFLEFFYHLMLFKGNDLSQNRPWPMFSTQSAYSSNFSGGTVIER